jgi:hypothetical protein
MNSVSIIRTKENLRQDALLTFKNIINCGKVKEKEMKKRQY